MSHISHPTSRDGMQDNGAGRPPQAYLFHQGLQPLPHRLTVSRSKSPASFDCHCILQLPSHSRPVFVDTAQQLAADCVLKDEQPCAFCVCMDRERTVRYHVTSRVCLRVIMLMYQVFQAQTGLRRLWTETFPFLIWADRAASAALRYQLGSHHQFEFVDGSVPWPQAPGKPRLPPTPRQLQPGLRIEAGPMPFEPR